MLDEADSRLPSFSATACGRRLHKLVGSRRESGEELVGWARVWVSRDGRWNAVFGARTRDFAVLTDRRLMLWTTGFFTRRPRRRVLTQRLDSLTVEPIGDGPLRRLRLRGPNRRVLRFEFGRDEESQHVARALQMGVETARTNGSRAPANAAPTSASDDPEAARWRW